MSHVITKKLLKLSTEIVRVKYRPLVNISQTSDSFNWLAVEMKGKPTLSFRFDDFYFDSRWRVTGGKTVGRFCFQQFFLFFFEFGFLTCRWRGHGQTQKFRWGINFFFSSKSVLQRPALIRELLSIFPKKPRRRGKRAALFLSKIFHQFPDAMMMALFWQFQLSGESST